MTIPSFSLSTADASSAPTADPSVAATTPSSTASNTATSSAARWQPPFLTLPVHAVIRHQIELGLKGTESTLLVGPPGVGKTFSVRTLLKQFDRQALTAQLNNQPAPKHFPYETGRAQGTKTALTDLYVRLAGTEVGKRSKQDWTPTDFLEQIVHVAAREKVRLIVIDEAQLINAVNIDHLRQLYDHAAAIGWSLRLFLIGNEELVHNVKQTGQLGERFSNAIRYPSLSPAHVGPHLGGFHHDLPGIQQRLGDKEWTKLLRELFTAAHGSFRRLTTVIENAHELAIRRGTPMTEKDLRLAIDKLVSLEID
jgi:hypothetical protein